ncbi:ABC transporter permease subunit [Chloroflexota bacterium]
MDQATEKALRAALALLQEGEPQEAAAILARVLARSPGNEQAWYLLSFALTDPDRQIYALQRVLRINPDNEKAEARLAVLSGPTVGPVPPPPLISRRAPIIPGPVSKPARPAKIQPALLKPQLPPPGPIPVMKTIIEWPDNPFPAQAAIKTVAAPAQILSFPGVDVRPRAEVSHAQRARIRLMLMWRRFREDWKAFSSSSLALLGLALIALFGLMAIAHPILIATVWPPGIYDPVTGFDINVFPHPSLPASGHILGTDTLGRDVLSMLLAATAPTFVLGITVALTTAIVGTTLSVLAAYFRGAADVIITNLADVFLLFPAPIIMVIIGARFRDLGPVPLGLIYGFVTGAGATVIVLRAHAMQIVSKPFMEAAHAAGGGAAHQITRHLLPAMLPLAALQMMIAVVGAVVADGFISFFGLTRTTSNWGTVIYDGFVYAGISSAQDSLWHMLLPAALCFSLFALGFYLVSRGLHRVASPTLRDDRPRR